MKPKTQEELIMLIDSIQLLVAAVTIHIGFTTATDILAQCERTKKALLEENGPVSN